MQTYEQMVIGANLMGQRYSSGEWDAVCLDGERVVLVHVSCSLRAGYSGQDHLFDRTLRTGADRSASCLWASPSGLLRSLRGISDRYGRAEWSVARVRDICGTDRRSLGVALSIASDDLRALLRSLHADTLAAPTAPYLATATGRHDAH